MNLAVISDADTIIVVGLLFTAVTIAIGLITIVAVFSQIDLARKQIDLANVQITLAREELEIVKVDLAQSTELFKRSNRESELWPFGLIKKHRILTLASQGIFELNLSVENTGEVVDRDCVVIVGIHESFQFNQTLNNDEWSPIIINNYGRFQNFTFFQCVSRIPIYPNYSIELPIMILQRSVVLTTDLDSVFILGRVSTNYAPNPTDANHYFRLRYLRADSNFIVNIAQEFFGKRALASDKE